MAPKKASPSGITPEAAKTSHAVSTGSSTPVRTKPASTTFAASSSASSSSTAAPSLRSAQDFQAIVDGLWRTYVANTPQRTKLLDAFMLFLVVVGAVQFVYCVIGGNFPFNAFLSGFSATVGQFVLTVSLRMQTTVSNAKEFAHISHERAFADYIFGSMILHFFCVNFIN